VRELRIVSKQSCVLQVLRRVHALAPYLLEGSDHWPAVGTTWLSLSIISWPRTIKLCLVRCSCTFQQNTPPLLCRSRLFKASKTRRPVRHQATRLLPYTNGHRDVEDLMRLEMIDVGQPLIYSGAYCHWIP
jgi:hypothetical protein